MTAQDLKNSILQLAVEGKLLKGGSLPLATAGKPSSATPSAGTPRNAPASCVCVGGGCSNVQTK